MELTGSIADRIFSDHERSIDEQTQQQKLADAAEIARLQNERLVEEAHLPFRLVQALVKLKLGSLPGEQRNLADDESQIDLLFDLKPQDPTHHDSDVEVSLRIKGTAPNIEDLTNCPFGLYLRLTTPGFDATDHYITTISQPSSDVNQIINFMELGFWTYTPGEKSYEVSSSKATDEERKLAISAIMEAAEVVGMHVSEGNISKLND